jgi:hypothetical protein
MVGDGRVTLVQQPISPTTMPPDCDPRARANLREEPPHASKRDFANASRLYLVDIAHWTGRGN